MAKSAYFVYTPLCGTCQVAGKMISILKEVNPEVSIEEYNLNFHRELAELYQIESVPCLLVFENGECIEKLYAFHSVPYLYDRLK